MKIPIIANTLTNYIAMAVRLLQGILATRWIIANLGEDTYGLWNLVWGFFAFALLLDLGFGVAAQKATATELWKKDLNRYNQTVSSIFCVHTAMGLLILPLTILGAVYVRELLHLPPSVTNLTYYRTCLLLGGVGAAWVFPLGVFPEILVGLQKLYIRNCIIILSKLTELAGVLLILHLNGNLVDLLVFVTVLMGLTQIPLMLTAYRCIPGLRIRPWFHRQAFMDMFTFSASAYIMSMSRILWERGSTLLLSIFCGLGSVGVFNLGMKLPMLLQQLAQPYVENISPISALLHARRHRQALGNILYSMLRWLNVFAAGVTVGILILAPEILQLLFHVASARVILICRIMTVLVYGIIMFRALPEKFLTMAEGHGFLSKVLAAECGVFLLLSFVLLWFFPSELSVVAAMIAAKFVSTACFIAPRFLRALPVPIWKFFLHALGAPLFLALLSGALFLVVLQLCGISSHDWLRMLPLAALGLGFYLATLYAAFLEPREKRQLKQLLCRGMRRRMQP